MEPTYPAVAGSVSCQLGLDQPLGVRENLSRWAQQMAATGVIRQLIGINYTQVRI